MRAVGILGAIARRKSQTAEEARAAALKGLAVRWKAHYEEKAEPIPTWIKEVLAESN